MGLNLHGVVRGQINAVNPTQDSVLMVSAGNTIDQDGKSRQVYATLPNVWAQVQALTYRDLQQLDGLNLTGTRRAIYLYGEVDSIVRVNNKGGDVVILPGGSAWLTAQVLEQFGNKTNSGVWCKVAATLQNESYMCADDQSVILDDNGNPIIVPPGPPVTFVTDDQGNIIYKNGQPVTE